MEPSSATPPAPRLAPASSTPLAASVSSLKRRRNLVKAACSRCRAGKVKCDGQRPSCGRCSKLGSNIACEWDVDDGDTRQDALRKRNAHVEKELQQAVGFIEALKSMPPEQRDAALAELQPGPSASSGLWQSNATTQTAGFATRLPGSPNSATQLSSFLYTPQSSVPFAPEAANSHIGRYNDPRLIQLPNGDYVPLRSIVEASVQAFFDQSSKLFHVFSREYVRLSLDEMYHEDATVILRRNAIAVVCSVAAVGCAYLPHEIGLDEMEDFLFDCAKMCLDDAIETSLAIAAKVCCVLGQRLLFEKHRASLTFIDMGLELCKRTRADCQVKPIDMTEAEWLDGRRTWRTLFFFSGWLSATVGYLSQNHDWVHRLGQQQDLSLRGETELEDIIQTAMVKVSILKFSILRFNLDPNPLTSISFGAMARDLRKWHDDLPAQMHLSSVPKSSMPLHLRRTTYFCHLLHLGCYMLLARRKIYSNFVSAGSPDSFVPPSHNDAIIEGAISSTQKAARILAVLLREKGVFKRCWLCIFQGYLALTMSLFAWTQALLTQEVASVNEHMECADICLEVLDYCRDEDPVASRFYQSCDPIFRFLHECAGTPRQQATLKGTMHTLLNMMCAPYAANESVTVIRGWNDCQTCDPRMRDFSLVISCVQGFEATNPFHRKVSNVAPGLRVQKLLDDIGHSTFINDPYGESFPNILPQV